MKQIAGYEILEVLEMRGMGRVYKARQPGTDRIVLLETAQLPQDAGPEQRERFRAHAAALARVQHPGIVHVLEVIEHEGWTYLVEEYVEGQSLAEKLSETPLPAAQAAQLVEMLARAVHAVHQNGIVHRDLKPAHVRLRADGTPVLDGFGPPLPAPGEMTQSGGIFGTPAYMAPEQARGDSQAISPASDVYSLGVILYQALTGRRPFQGGTVVDTLRQAMQQEPELPHRLNPQVPRDLEVICLKCLQKDPQRRYPTAAALAEDLQRFLQHQPITVGRTRGGPRAVREEPTPPPAAPAPTPIGFAPGSAQPGPVVAELSGLSVPEGAAVLRGKPSVWQRPAAGKVRPDRGGAELPGGVVDPVSFTVTTPPWVRPGTPCVIDVWAHFERQRQEVLHRAREAAGGEVRCHSKGPVQVARGSVLTVRLQVEGVLIPEPEDTVWWDGEIGNATFPVQVPAGVSEGPKQGQATILLSGLQIARVHFILPVSQAPLQREPPAQREERHRKAFASYATADRNEVLARVQGLQKAAPGLEIFLDVFSLRSGQYWERELWEVIPRNDVFYLFWSANARKSEWVEKEWRCALKTRGLDFIDPVPLEPPHKVPPPPELAEKHFNDWVLAFMHTQHARRSEPVLRRLLRGLRGLVSRQ
jgi:Protein kinase domain/TIR domain